MARRKTVFLGSLGHLAMLATGSLAQEARTITVATHYTEEQAAPLLACFDAYEAEHPGLTIEHQQTAYGDFLQTILTSRVGGTAPDITNVYSIWVPQLAAAGAIEAPPADIAEWINANYSPATVGAATIGGQLWGIPTELSVYALVYNKQLLEAAGFTEPPKTWAELRDMAQAITAANDQGNIAVGGYAYGTSVAEGVHPFYAQMFAAGVSPFAERVRDCREASLGHRFRREFQVRRPREPGRRSRFGFTRKTLTSTPSLSGWERWRPSAAFHNLPNGNL